MKVIRGTTVEAKLAEHCPWNPRGEITPESVADITASIKEKGLLQDIGIMEKPGESGHYWVIYGNRRFVAAKEAGLKKIPCNVYIDITEQDAREITRIENEVRLGIDPIEDAKLLHSFIEAGRTYEDVALIFGVSPATVCRREKLIDLDQSILKIVKENPGKLATNALEHIAAYPSEIQKKTSMRLQQRVSYTGGIVGWNDFKHVFDTETSNLDHAKWVVEFGADKVPCTACMERTGAQANLFGDLEDDEKLGCCLNKTCFKKMVADFTASELRKKIPDACTERVEVNYLTYEVGFVDKYSKKNAPCAYYVVYTDGSVDVKFGPSKAARDAELARQKEEADAARAARTEREEKKRKINLKVIEVMMVDENAQYNRDDLIASFFKPVKGEKATPCEKFLALCSQLEMDFQEATEHVDIAAVKKDPARAFLNIFGEHLSERADDWHCDEFILNVIKTLDCTGFLTQDEINFITRDEEED